MYRLDLGYDYGTVATYRYNTTIAQNGSGAEQRNSNWSQPLASYQIGDRTLNRIELNRLIQFHHNRKGAWQPFLFRDWCDYKAVRSRIGLGTGGRTAYQLRKAYPIESVTSYRPITHPLASTVVVYLDGVPSNAFSIADGGQINFEIAPAPSTIITADFEFDIPVRFATDEIQFRFEAADDDEVIFRLEPLSLQEIRFPAAIPIPLGTIVSDLEFTLNLGYDYGTIGGDRFKTEIIAIGADYERRTAQWDTPLGRWNIGDRSLNTEEKDYFLSVFRGSRGAASSFRYYDWAQEAEVTTRFESDQLSIRFEVYDSDTDEAIYQLSGLPIVETVAPTPVTYQQFASPESQSLALCRCTPKNVVLSDNNFNSANWDFYHLTAPPGFHRGTASVVQAQKPGTSDNYRKVILSAIAQAITPSLVYTLNVHKAFNLNLVPGERISRLDFKFDRSIIVKPLQNEPGTGLLIIQNNKAYLLGANSGVEPWTTVNFLNTQESDYRQVCSNVSLGDIDEDSNAHPDFSQSMQFGVFVADTNLFPGAPAYNGQEIGIDNLEIKISTSCP